MATAANRKGNRSNSSAILNIRDLQVYYGQSHALQGVNLVLEKNVLAVVGRNGMGKTTLCNTIMGLKSSQSGSIRFHGEEISNLPPYKVASRGVAFIPQGRRLWHSLTVDEHLKLSTNNIGLWSIDRIYDTFPRIYERRRNKAGQLSGGEQQMLAISRALLQNPELLVLDEPTEGLAPIIVNQVENILSELAQENDVSILLIEQNISAATSISEDIAIMVNGRIDRVLPSRELASDLTLQQQLLGVGRHAHESLVASPETVQQPEIESSETKAEQSEDAIVDTEPEQLLTPPANLIYVPPTRWSSSEWKHNDGPLEKVPQFTSEKILERPFDKKIEPLFKEPTNTLKQFQREEVFVVGTFDTKGKELNYIRDLILEQGSKVRTVDLSTSEKLSSADVPPHQVASYHPKGPSMVFTDQRGASVREMGLAFERWILYQRDVGGIISAGGSGGTAMVTPAMRCLPVGIPKVMISTVASGDVGQYVGSSDIMMMYSVTDIQGLNQISMQVLANGAYAIAGMMNSSYKKTTKSQTPAAKPCLGMTMFGVTTPAVQQISTLLEEKYECLVFHATGTGGRSMEKLADSGMLAAVIDLTTTEVCDMFVGGVFPADEDRFGAFIRSEIPFVGSVGAMDMVNFGAKETVPEKFRQRTFVEHNPQVTLMRTTAEENSQMGEWIAGRMNEMNGPVRFLLPEKGVSVLDAPGEPFHDLEANQALFEALKRNIKETGQRRLISLPYHINDQGFAEALVDSLDEINKIKKVTQHAAF